MTESVKTHAFLKTLAALAVFGLLGLVVWPRLDQSESRIVLTGSILAVALAFYSIFDLQKQRNEKFRHTLDRLVRAAFVTMTLVFVVEIATKPAPEVGTTIVYEKVLVNLADELRAKEATWTKGEVEPVVARHFAGLVAERAVELALPKEQRVRFKLKDGKVDALEVKP